MVSSCCGWVADGRSLVVGGLGLELGAQPPGGAAQAPFGAFGAAGGPGEREQALGGALGLGVGEQLVLPAASWVSWSMAGLFLSRR
jgi:hypothetical protein